VTELQVPVYFLHGIHDFTVSYPLAKAYFEQLRAPMKGFYTFEQSAHSPLFEEPQKMRQIMLADVLTGANGLADADSAPYAPSTSRPASASSGTEAPSV
jgi:alpha-beta hydrolase superfamily lysophospholipase